MPMIWFCAKNEVDWRAFAILMQPLKKERSSLMQVQWLQLSDLPGKTRYNPLLGKLLLC
jgi:hypothetical protein